MITDTTTKFIHYYALNCERIIDVGKLNALDPKITLNGEGITLGCSFININAAKHLIKQWEKNFGQIEKTITLQ